jgi:dihydrofolate reductase
MASLIYAAIASLDGYINDRDGGFEWAAPDEEVHAAINDLERGIGTYYYGRRMYEVMRFWETAPTDREPQVFVDYAEIWRGVDKVVFSSTLAEVDTPRTRLERQFDPKAVAAWKAEAHADISIGGPTLAAHALAAGLVDEVHLYLHPLSVGGGTPALPPQVRLNLRLLDTRRFDSGVAHLHYAVSGSST